ncbi:TIGR03857 family LLM class F420-dependent oxidoreductase [Gordonia jinghuaiqii]|uniref:TIGR03857 family LLM class F420-dependent oxidoreductase n=1 Tax=Gordonia jinghuaiqii TaxID=2758710 RepID=A0A7D7LVK8_9ACTN|nr:TIGR03857 family LLM class F420-dependent oxidoreductase [Gordonia jinghuaiqii]MCR5979415.1 TIGR03857 family LLM class F420-dependent oxidoreductase [Gordonia jinghuaiqii]MCR5979836.1 TIGR03857 family LLM class F420-dependent oxidoreductase [Gordonia jinghuaiqii]QMT00778.1 TIGR03857 family LLM class F420-dependent oxidoreductase [Gordonia jinghuaiqii]
MEQLTELGYYALSRHPVTPRELAGEARHAEDIGLGTAFVSERFNVKDAAALCGALAGATETLGIATAATNHNTRHPIVTATMGATLSELSGGRFALGLGRGITPQWQILGLPIVTGAALADMTGLLRRLWAGEMVVGHDGPAGSYPLLTLGVDLEAPPPILLVTMSPKTLELAGAIADGVVLHTYFSDNATRRAVACVRESAERAGRDPASIRIWSVVATVGDHLDETDRLRRLHGRLATYLQGYPDQLMGANGWDPVDLERVRATAAFAGARGPIDATATAEELVELADAIPASWVSDCAAGSPSDCAETVAEQFDLDVDSVILHGATPTELAPVVEAYRDIRPDRAGGLPVNPGRMRS